jgi:hypothetical protein
VVNKSLPIEKLRKHVVPFAGVAGFSNWIQNRGAANVMYTGDASLDLEGEASDGEDGPPQALAGSVVENGVGAMDTLAHIAAAVVDAASRVLAAAVAPAVGAQGAAPVAEGAGDIEQRIRRTVPGLLRGNLTMAVLKSQLQMYGGASFVLDDNTRYKAPNAHIFNKGAIKRAELLDAWRRFMDTPDDRGGFDPDWMLSDDDLVVRKAAPGSCAGTRREAAGTRRGAAATGPTAHLPQHVDPLCFHAAGLYLDRWKRWIAPGEMARAEAQSSGAAAGVMDTLTAVLDALLASAVAVIEKDTLFHCVAEQIVERLPEGRRHFGHLCPGAQRVVCGIGGLADPCVALGDCAHLSKGVELASAHLQRRRMDVLFLKYRTYGYDSARGAVRSGRVGGLTGLATNIGAAHVVVSAALGLCTDAYTTGCWEKLSQTEQKRLVDAVAVGVALGDARGANPTLTMSHLPFHRSSLASRMFAGVKQLCGLSTTLGQLSPGSRAALDRCEELVQEGGHRRWPSVGNISRASVQADIVVETGLAYAVTLALRRSNVQGHAQTERRRKRKRKSGEGGELGEEDDGDDGDSDYEGVAGQESAGRSGGVSLGDGNDAPLGKGKDAASDGE